MGLDLRILPVYDVGADFSTDVITFDRDYSLFDKIAKMSKKYGIEVKHGGIHSYLSTDEEYAEPHYGVTKEDPYNDKLKYLRAKQLKLAIGGYRPDTAKNNAVVAFIMELPDDLEVYLYWC